MRVLMVVVLIAILLIAGFVGISLLSRTAGNVESARYEAAQGHVPVEAQPYMPAHDVIRSEITGEPHAVVKRSSLFTGILINLLPLILILMVGALVLLLFVRVFQHLLAAKPANVEADGRMMQELHQRAMQMEARLESLETVLLERFK